MLIDWQKPHGTNIFFWPRHWEDILGRPEDQLGTPAYGTPDTVIVKVGLDLRDVVGRKAGGVRFQEISVVAVI